MPAILADPTLHYQLKVLEVTLLPPYISGSVGYHIACYIISTDSDDSALAVCIDDWYTIRNLVCHGMLSMGPGDQSLHLAAPGVAPDQSPVLQYS